MQILKIKKRPPYHPAFDFYKPLRDHIIDLHQNNRSKSDFLHTKDMTSDNKKWKTYEILITKYKEFWGAKKTNWFNPPRKKWVSNDVNVLLNPELGLIIKDVPHVIKLYMKGEKLSRTKATTSLFLMHQKLPVNYEKVPIIYCILDVRQNNLIKTSVFPNNILSSIVAEAAYITCIWHS
jgi:hypothetical protein